MFPVPGEALCHFTTLKNTTESIMLPDLNPESSQLLHTATLSHTLS
jgi:hypothetical protein